jgi:hypothetical protein
MPSERCSYWHCYYNTLRKTLWLKCHIQWLYLAVHGCKTYLNLNLRRGPRPFTHRSLTGVHVSVLLMAAALSGPASGGGCGRSLLPLTVMQLEMRGCGGSGALQAFTC